MRISVKDEGNLQHDLDSLTESGLIHRQRKVSNESYLFRHALIREAAYETISRTRKKEIHQSIAETLCYYSSINGSDFSTEVARHYAQADQYEDAVTYGLTAIRKQVGNSSNDEAIAQYKLVSRWLMQVHNKLVQQREELKLNTTILPAFSSSKGWGCDEIFEIGLRNEHLIDTLKKQSSTGLDETQQLLEHKSNWASFVYHHCQSNRLQARDIGEKMLAQTIAANNHAGEVAVTSMLAQAYLTDGDFLRAKSLFGKAIALYDEVTDINISSEYGVDPYAYSYGNISLVTMCLGFPDTAMRYAKLGVAAAEKTNLMVAINNAYIFQALLASLLGERDLVRKTVACHKENHGHRAQDDWVMKYFDCINDWAYYETANAERLVRETLASGQHFALSWYEPSLAETYIYHGEYDRAISLMENSLERCKASGEMSTIALAEKLLAIAYYRRDGGLSEASKKHIFNAIKTSRHQNTKWLELESVYEYTQMLVAQGTKDKVPQLLGSLLDWFKEGDNYSCYENANALYHQYS